MIDLDAGKYAAFVWPAYGLTLMVFAILVAGSLSHAGRWKKRAQDLTRQDSGQP